MYDRFQSSQQTISSFCEREGINKHTFQYWRRKILVERSRSKATEPLVGFRQIFPEETQNKNVLRLHLSPSVDLELPFDYPTANLIQLLRGVSC